MTYAIRHKRNLLAGLGLLFALSLALAHESAAGLASRDYVQFMGNDFAFDTDFEDASGLAFDPYRRTFWVTNSEAGKNAVVETDLNGVALRTFDLNFLDTTDSDVEAVTLIRPGTLAFVLEAPQKLAIAKMPDDTEILKAEDVKFFTLPSEGTEGVQSVAYNSAEDVFYYVGEKDPIKIYKAKINAAQTELTVIDSFEVAANFPATDVSDVAYFPRLSPNLFLLSQESLSVVEVAIQNGDGRVKGDAISSFDLSTFRIPKPKGLSFDPHGSLFVVGAKVKGVEEDDFNGFSPTVPLPNSIAGQNFSRGFNRDFDFSDLFEDYSGIAMNLNTKTLFVTNSKEGKNVVIETDAQGNEIRTINLNVLDAVDADTEGITWIKDNQFAIAMEKPGKLAVVNLPPELTTLSPQDYTLYSMPSDGTDGVQSVAYNAAEDAYYYVGEKNPIKIYKATLDPVRKKLTVVDSFVVSPLFPATDVSDAAFFPQLSPNLFLLSQESRVIVEVDSKGDALSVFDLYDHWIPKPKGMCQAANGSIFVVGGKIQDVPDRDITRFDATRSLDNSLAGLDFSRSLGQDFPFDTDFENISGVTYSPKTRTLFVTNSKKAGNVVIEIDANGEDIRTVDLNALDPTDTDSEGVAWIKEDLFGIVMEVPHKLALVSLPPGARTINLAEVRTYNFHPDIPVGVKGIAYNASDDTYYVASGQNPVKIFHLKLNEAQKSTDILETIAVNPAFTSRQISDVALFPGFSNNLFLLSQDLQKIVEVSLVDRGPGHTKGDLVSQYDLSRWPLPSPEGMHFDPNGSLHVVGRKVKGVEEDDYNLFTPAISPYARGDVDQSGVTNISDPIKILSFLFTAGKAPACVELADVNADNTVNITDPIYLLSYLFLGGSAPSNKVAVCAGGGGGDGDGGGGGGAAVVDRRVQAAQLEQLRQFPGGEEWIKKIQEFGLASAAAVNGGEVKLVNNLFRPSRASAVTIFYHPVTSGQVTMKLYSSSGEFVTTVLDQNRSASADSVDWNGRNDENEMVASGTYFLLAEGPGFKTTKKIVVVR